MVTRIKFQTKRKNGRIFTIDFPKEAESFNEFFGEDPGCSSRFKFRAHYLTMKNKSQFLETLSSLDEEIVVEDGFTFFMSNKGVLSIMIDTDYFKILEVIETKD